MKSQIISSPDLFDFRKTIEHLTHYRQRSGADVNEDNVYYRVINYKKQYLPVAVQQAAQQGKLIVGLPDHHSMEELNYAVNKMSQMLGFGSDLSGFYESVQHDPPLERITKTFYGLSPSLSESIFEALVTAVIGQQISATVARVIRDLIVDTFGVEVQAFSKTLKSFPSPETILAATHEELRAVKLSGRKAEYLHDISLKILEGEIDEEKFHSLDDKTIIEELIKARGIGRWTAQWILIRAMGRSDVSPSGDLVLKKSISELYNINKPLSDSECEVFMKNMWSPYRSFATTYLFANLRTQRALLSMRNSE